MRTKSSPFILFIIAFSLIRTFIPFVFSEWGEFWVPSEELRARILLENELFIQILCLLGAHFVYFLATRSSPFRWGSFAQVVKNSLNRRNIFVLMQELASSFRQNFFILMGALFLAVWLGVAQIESPHHLWHSFFASLWHSLPQLIVFALWLGLLEYSKFLLKRSFAYTPQELGRSIIFSWALEFYLVFCFLLSFMSHLSVVVLSLMAATWVMSNFLVSFVRGHEIDDFSCALKRVLSLSTAVYLSFFFFGFEFFGWRSVSFLQSFLRADSVWSVTISLYLFILLGRFILESCVSLFSRFKLMKNP